MCGAPFFPANGPTATDAAPTDARHMRADGADPFDAVHSTPDDATG